LDKIRYNRREGCIRFDWQSLDLWFVSKTLEDLGLWTYNHPSWWWCSLRRGSVAATLLGLWVRIPSGEWICIFCECYLLSGRGLCDGPIPRPEELYRAFVCLRVFFCVRVINMTDCWLEVSIRKVLRPATSTQVFLGFPVSISEYWDGSQVSKSLLHASHVALQT
jgi:hypothetical protein